MCTILKATFCRKPNWNWTFGSKDMGNWRVAKNNKKQKILCPLFGYILKSIFPTSDWFCLITPHLYTILRFQIKWITLKFWNVEKPFTYNLGWNCSNTLRVHNLQCYSHSVRALKLESGTGMCRSHVPFFQASRRSLAYQFTINAPLMCPSSLIFRKILHF